MSTSEPPVLGPGADGPPPVAVLWDLDGTLLFARPVAVRLFLDAFTEATGHAPPERIPPTGGWTDWMITGALVDGLPPAAAAEVRARGDAVQHAVFAALAEGYRRAADDLAACVEALPGVGGTVAAVHAAGAVQTVVTGNTPAAARGKLTALDRAHGLDLLGRLQLGLGGYGDRPGPRAGLVEEARSRLAARHGAAPPLVVVGDTPRDVEAAHTAGALAVGVATGSVAADELREAGADHVLPDLSDPSRLVAVLRAAGEDRPTSIRRSV